MGKGQHGILQTLPMIEHHLSFALRDLDSDNGNEFINCHLVAFCQRPEGQVIQFTRSRPYTKDDNAHVEQKNWTQVRTFVGWDRYDTREAQQVLTPCSRSAVVPESLPALDEIAAQRAPLLLRRSNRPRTSFDRVCACAEVDVAKVVTQERVLARTNPFALAQRLDRVAALRSWLRSLLHEHALWRGWSFRPRAPQARAVSHRNSTHTIGSGSAIVSTGRPARRGPSGASAGLTPR